MATLLEVGLPIAGVAVGYCLNILKDELRFRRNRIREQATRERKERVRRERRRAEFQVKVVSELEELIKRHVALIEEPMDGSPEDRIHRHHQAQETRIRMQSLVGVVEDEELKKVVSEQLDAWKALEYWRSGGPDCEGYYPDSQEEAEMTLARNRLSYSYEQARHHVVRIQSNPN